MRVPLTASNLKIYQAQVLKFESISRTNIMQSATTSLANFMQKYAALPEQGSEAWLKGRINAIGASELASYLGLNKYKSAENALKEKTGICDGPYAYDPNFLWGHLWEPIHRAIIERRLKTNIHEMGAIPYGDGEYESRYKNSPDGVFTVSRAVLEAEFGEKSKKIEYDEDGNTCGVLELKAPVTRAITSEIPSYYVPQMFSNMCIVNPAAFGIFSEIAIRRCAIDDISTEKYTHTFYRNGRASDSINGAPIHKGIICFYAEGKTKYRNAMRITSSDSFCDFGSCSSELFFDVVKDWRQGKITLKYIDLPSDEDIEQTNLLGVCAWKCYAMSFHFVHKRPKYIEQVWPVIRYSLEAIDHIRGGADEDEKIERLAVHVDALNVLNARLRVDYA